MEKEKHNRKTVRIAPYNRFDLQSLEKYMAKMAKKGLFVKHLGFVSVFEKGEPKEVIYRIDPMQTQYAVADEDLNAEQCAAYNEQGWTFVNTYAGVFMIYVQNSSELEAKAEKEQEQSKQKEQESEKTDRKESQELPDLSNSHLVLTDTDTYTKLKPRLKNTPTIVYLLIYYTFLQLFSKKTFCLEVFNLRYDHEQSYFLPYIYHNRSCI